MKKLMTTLFMFAALFASINVLSSCKDYDEDEYNDLTIKVNKNYDDLKKLIDDLTTAQQNCKSTCDSRLTALENALKNDYYTKDDITSLFNQWVGSKSVADQLADLKTTLEGELNDYAKKSDLDKYVLWDDLLAQLTVLKSNYYTKSEIDNIVEGLQDVDSTALSNAAKAHALAEYDSLWIENYGKQAIDDIADLQSQVADLKPYIDSLAEVSAKNFQTAIALAKQGDEILQGEIDDILSQVQTLDQKLTDLTGRVTAVENTLKNQLTSIEVQATYNPVFGTFNFPADVKSNVLMAFYGEASSNIYFPTTRTGGYPWAEQALTAKEWEMIDGNSKFGTDPYIVSGETLLSDADNNAGKVYLTLNPSTVNFDGLTFDLVNSLDSASGVKLINVAPSTEKLTLGYTRAAENGFYEADAHIYNIDEVQKVDLDKQGFKDIVSDLIHNRSNFDITNAATTVLDQLDGILDAEAVKSTYYNEVLKENSNVYSNYSIAATAIKPLSYKFGQEYYGRETLPGYERAENFIDRVANKAKDEIEKEWPNLNLETKQFTIENITLDSLEFAIRIQTDNKTSRAYVQKEGNLQYLVLENYVKYTNEWQISMKIALDDPAAKVKGAEGEWYDVYGTNDGNYTWDLDIKKGIDTKDILTQINGSLANVDKFLADVNKMLADVNETESTLTSETTKFADKLKTYLNKINNKGISLINSAIDRMQPCMLVTTDEGTTLGINAVNYPTTVGTDFTLVPTSFTYEILTPAYLKHVACVNVLKDGKSAQDGDADCKNVLNDVNDQANMNTILDGSVRKIELSGLKSGYTYQFAYSAVDYSGNVCTKRVAVRVK